ncbi:hypothetical protein SEA_DAUBENSKI_248 [Streptomyces phage Daubenski]|uniref:Large ribosomal subunit protein bL12 C-terminal domain-containing protein n=1 Tax=Streptomyces phage Daubenski TaxID=2653725 RepID=A0A5Q2WIG7_9CAUD|nr:hypothetical protein KNU80_gp004 [Streptomyces phage Daubenski]YP_010104972.1 hypothetical protein KNU80_gp057 [Streptomyces phage Daubenski]QGH76315.1 hypothetical protein SEA_DAUBENSKI_4 [Streptomyces phage Daubenski]QGH76513.1 hypothetical protein SEA_DAUBENSKI_248 [Streptomyces phage Daubenski]
MHLGDIIDILNERSDSTLSLNDAVSMARDILALHQSKVNEVSNSSYDEGYKSGHEVGKSLVSVPTPDEWELTKLRRVYEMAVQRAHDNVASIVVKHGSDRKIPVIKELRAMTGLGLKDTKDIVDDYCRKLDAAGSYYSDEPPF